MRPIVTIGILLILASVLFLGYQGVTYITTRDTVARVGPVEVQTERDRPVPLGPILSGIALAGGIILVAIGARRRSA